MKGSLLGDGVTVVVVTVGFEEIYGGITGAVGVPIAGIISVFIKYPQTVQLKFFTPVSVDVGCFVTVPPSEM